MNNQAYQKLSPNHALTDEQNHLIKRIINFSANHLQNNDVPAVFTIYGDAGINGAHIGNCRDLWN